MLTNPTRVAILGAGMAGMAAAKALRDQDCVVYESRSHAGGHASSFNFDGFICDEGPHLSFTPNERMRGFLARSVDNRYFEWPAYANNYFQGHYLKHPAQCNLHGLPPDLVARCIGDAVRAKYELDTPIETYQDWCYKSFGKEFADVFTGAYTRKYWNREMRDLTVDWVSARIYAPKVEEMVIGALTAATDEHYYMSKFYYPEQNGFGNYNSLLIKDTPIRYNSKVVEVDFEQKKLTLIDGTEQHFEHLISSLPLPVLISICKDAPQSVRDAAHQLVCTSHFLVSIGVNRPSVSEAYWTYYYDEDIPFSRVSFQSKYSQFTARPNTSTIQAEIVHSRWKELGDPDNVVEKTIEALLKVGLLHSRDEILALDSRNIKFSNVVFDFNRVAARAIVREYLEKNNVHWCGRFGEWEYLWTDQSMLSGERAANEVRAALGLGAVEFDAGL